MKHKLNKSHSAVHNFEGKNIWTTHLSTIFHWMRYLECSWKRWPFLFIITSVLLDLRIYNFFSLFFISTNLYRLQRILKLYCPMHLLSYILVLLFTHWFPSNNQYCLQIYYHRFHLFATEMRKKTNKQTNELRCCKHGIHWCYGWRSWNVFAAASSSSSINTLTT